MSPSTLPFGISVCGLTELSDHCSTGASHVLSILDPGTAEPWAFRSYGRHERLELHFHDIIDSQPGMQMPQPEDVVRILGFGRQLREAQPGGAHLLVHCHAGISRSTAALALIVAEAMPERRADRILSLVHGLREKAWPNLRLMEIGDTMLGRNGALVRATHALYRLQLERRPQLAEFMETGGRGREIAAARQAPVPLGRPALPRFA